MSVPPPDLAELLRALPPHRRELFEARVERWWPDLLDGLSVYADPAAVGERVVALAARAFAERDDELHALDLRRTLAPDWFQRPEAVGYAAYVDRFAGDLRGVVDKVGHLQRLGVTYLHLLPLLKPRPGDNDGGYAVMDYRSIREDLGTMEDLRDLTGTLRGEGISLCLDLVLNHVAAEHEWAVRARAGEQRYRDYFHVERGPGGRGRVGGDPARGVPGLRAGQLHLGRRPRRPGSGRPSTAGSGTSTGPTRTSSASTPTSCSTWPTTAWRRSGSTPSPSRGSASAPPARTSPRCTPSPRPCAPSPAWPPPPPSSRRRRSSGRATSCSTSARAVTTARSATSPTTTGSWCRSGRCSPRATSGWPPRRCSGSTRSRPRPRGSPTPAATTTSAGPSTTATPRPSGCTGGATGRSSRTSTAATSPGRGPAGWSSSTTPPPATDASRARWPASPGSSAATRSPWTGSCWPTRWCSAGAACRCSGWATRWGCSTTPTGPTSPGTRATTGGRTGRACPGRSTRTASSSSAYDAWSGPARRPRTCTPRPAPRCSTPTTPASC